jgi:hypothetical protein
MNWDQSNVILYTYKDLEDFYNLENDTYDFINVDVEGHELIVLDQIRDILTRCRLICVEKTEDTNRNDLLEKKLNEIGFSVFNKTIDNFLAKNVRYKY